MTTSFTTMNSEQPMAQVENIGPSDARLMLGRNTDNRRLRRGLVSKYASLMQQGHWVFTGEPIIIDSEGVVANGQHRLHAIIAAEVPQNILVVRGVEPKARDAIDTGTPRTPADILTLRGEKHAEVLASMTRYAIAYQRNPNGLWRSGRKGIPVQDIINEILAHPEYREYAQRASHLRRSKILTAATWAMSMKILAAVDPDDEYTFAEKLATGAMLEKNDPILTLRKRLTDMRMSPVPVSYDPRDYCALVVRAWNAWRRGDAVARLMVRSKTGEFPTPI